MAAVTQVIPNFLGGVSKQIDQKKLPGQVRECLNAYPDPTFGLRKRPGFKFIKHLHTSSVASSPDFANAKWFFIKRDNEEKYIGCILDSDVESTNPIKIWNATDGTACTVTYTGSTKDYLDTTRDNYDILTVQDTSLITNKTTTVTAQTAPTYTDGSKGTVRLLIVKYSCKYSISVKIDSTTHTIDYTTIADEGSLSDGDELVNTAEKILSELKTDLDALSPTGTLTTTQLEATLELSFVTPTVTATPTGNGTGNGTNGTLTNLATTTGGSGTGLTVNVVIEGNVATNITVHTGGKNYAEDDVITISKSLIPGTGTGSKIDADVTTTIASLDDKAITVTTSDNHGNANITGFTNQVNIVSDLPAYSLHNRVVKIINSSEGTAEDTYWSKFVAEDATSGAGYWEETIDPTVSAGMDASTLPHELRNTAANTFNLQEADWTDRLTGDTVTNKNPSFVGEKIQQTFFHNNRLGLLTEDNVVMSQTSDFYNFYFTSALISTDADPIDINCSSIRPAVLHGVIPTAQGLILFSKNQQFIMFSDTKILTPSSAIIRGISNYEMDSTIDPVDVGTHINFVSKTPSYTRIFGMATRGSEESPVVQDISKVVSEWVPDTVTSLLTSPQNFLIALYGTLDNTMYMHKTYTVGERVLMQAWFKWDFPGNIQHAAVDSDTMWTIIEHSGKYVLASASLTQTPEETIIVNSEGQQVNPHMDLYGAVSSMTYDSTNKLTKCYLPTGYRDNADLTPVLVIAGNGTDNFAGVTESGFTITPNRPTGQTHATASPYFEVPGKDISALTEADVIVGYKYNYDVELPKTYFRLDPEGKQYDYTAALTVARMKFGVGLSSVIGFKVNSKGRHTPYEEYKGVGTTFADALVANGTGSGPEGNHTVLNCATTTSGSGTGMTVDVTMAGGVATAVTANTEGTGYAASDTVTIANTITLTSANVTATIATVGQTEFPFNLDYSDSTDLNVKINGVKNTAFSITNDANRDADKILTFTTAPDEDDDILLYTNNWYDIQPVQDANQYLADDVPLTEETVFTLPIHQRSENFNVRVFSNSPFPVSLITMMWEGQYSPRFYRRT